jgi:eukaryotic-like serine/threonine-protein kinase
VTKLGKYELIHELGRGGMGIVYRARDPIINRLVALKTITAGVADYPNLLERFYREAQSAGGLQHPNIVTIYDMGEASGTPYIAMELIEGETLEQLIAERPDLPLSLKLTYAIQACRAFDYAHKRGIVHRDIKPANVMLSKEGTVKVVDFGIARVLESSKTQTGMLIGTFAYMSPEQYHGEHADERSDIWSFGILLFELLTYQKPFGGENPASLMHSICHKDPTSLRQVAPECPPELEAVLQKILQKSPAERFQTMEDLMLELDPICKGLQSATVAKLVDQGRDLVKQGNYSQARDLLRQALQVESTNTQARSLLEKVNAELKRVLIRPKAQQFVEKGLELLAQGKVQEARLEAENALKLDTSFEPAQQLKERVQQELDRFQLVAEHLDAAKLRLAEGLPEMAEGLLQKVLELEPSNQTARHLQLQVATEKAQRERRLRLLETMQRARSLWTLQNYKECIEILTGLAEEFPQEEEVLRLLYTAREDLAEQRKQQTLEKAKILLADGRHEQCIAVLSEVQQAFPNDPAIVELLDAARQDEANQRRLQGLAEARRLFAGRHYDECMSVLAALQKEFHDDPELEKLLEAARGDQLQQDRQQRIAKARKLLAARRYDESSKLLSQLQQDFPADDEVNQLLASLRDEEAEQHKLRLLAEARSLLASRRYDESLALLTRLQKQYTDDDEITRLLETLRADQSEQLKSQRMAEARKLLADKRYEEVITLLTSLQESFPREDEITKLLDIARKDRAERQKQEKLAAARSRLAAGVPGEALEILEGLRKTDPNDPAVQKLLVLVQGEQDRQSKLARLQREWNTLKALVGEKKYTDVIARAELLLADFPADSDLLRLVEFARDQQAQLDQEVRLRKTRDAVKSLFSESRFQDAAKVAKDALKTFPGNKELLQLHEQAEVQEKKLQTRKAIEQRIRDIRVKINRQKFSEAVQMARETLVTLGPDTGVTQLLNSAQVEIAAREKKRRQEREIESIRLLIKQGQLDGATQALNEALAAETLVNFDPRVQRVSDEINQARNQTSAPSPSKPDSGPPPGLSKEYAWEGPPPEDLGGVDAGAQAKLAEPQSSAPPPTMSVSPVAPAAPEAPPVAAPPPSIKPLTPIVAPKAPAPPMKAPPVVEWPAPVTPSQPPQKVAPPAPAEPVAPPPAPPRKFTPPAPPEPVAPPSAPPRKASRPAPPASDVPPHAVPPPAPLPARARPLPPVVTAPAPRPEPVRVILPWKRPAVIGVIAAVLVAAVWFGLRQPSTERVNPSNPTPTVTTQPTKPAANPLEVRQQEAMDQADQRRASGDLSGAAQILQSASALNGPLTADIQRKQAEIQAEINDARLGALRQKEEQDWQNAKKDVDAGNFRSAEKYLGSILAMPGGGLRKDDARKYRDQVIPQRKQEETLWAQAKKDSLKSDSSSLKQADDTLAQVIQLGGPRKPEAEQLRQTVEGRLASLAQQQQQQQQITDLRSGAQHDLAQGDFSSARQKVDQIKRAGGDPGSLSAEIEQAEARQKSEADFQQIVQKYQGASDKNSLEAARNSFQSVAQAGGTHAADARRYVSEINAKLASLNQETTPPLQPVPKVQPPPQKTDERTAISSLIQQYEQACEQRDADALARIWPGIGKRYDKYKSSFDSASAYHVNVHIDSLEVTPDTEAATVNASLFLDYTPKKGKMISHRDKAVFQMQKSNGVWLIKDVQ